MNEGFDMVKWLASQSDRVLFIVTLCVCGWFAWRQQKRSEVLLDKMAEQNEAQRIIHHERMAGITASLFETTNNVTKVVATNTSALYENTKSNDAIKDVLQQVKARL